MYWLCLMSVLGITASVRKASNPVTCHDSVQEGPVGVHQWKEEGESDRRSHL